MFPACASVPGLLSPRSLVPSLDGLLAAESSERPRGSQKGVKVQSMIGGMISLLALHELGLVQSGECASELFGALKADSCRGALAYKSAPPYSSPRLGVWKGTKSNHSHCQSDCCQHMTLTYCRGLEAHKAAMPECLHLGTSKRGCDVCR